MMAKKCHRRNPSSIEVCSDSKQVVYTTDTEKSTKKCPDGADTTVNHQSFCASVLLKLSTDSPFHGATQILEEQTYMLRRLIWALVCLGGTSLCLIQLVNNLNYYWDWPVSVNIKINYNDSVIFPAVTICNANSFRLSKAYSRGYYFMLTDLYGNNDINTSAASDITLEQIHQETGHQLQQLLVSCKWESSPCTVDNFTQVLTDFGLCYTFNSGEDLNSLRKAFSTGSGGGLSLELNLEQYEYMHGPNEGAGLRVLVHHNSEQPLVADYGIAVQSGSHSFISAKIVQMNNLPPKHGECNDSVQLHYYDQYTVDSCYLDCKEKYLVKECNCREMYMPSYQGNPAACTLKQYAECGNQKLGEFSSIRKQCMCPVDCHRRIYQAKISHASTSNFDLESLIKNDDLTTNLLAEYTETRDIEHKVDQRIVSEDTYLIDAFTTRLKQLKHSGTEVVSALANVDEMLWSSYRDINRLVELHVARGLKLLDANLVESYIVGWEELQSEALLQLREDFLGLRENIKTVVLYVHKYFTNQDRRTRQLAMLPITVHMEARFDMIRESRKHLDKLRDAFEYAQRLKELDSSIIPLRYQPYVNLIDSIVRDSKNLVPDVFKNISVVLAPAENNLNLMVSSMADFTSAANKFVTRNTRLMFLNRELVRGYLSFKQYSQMLNDIVEQITKYIVNPPHQFLLARIQQFTQQNKTLRQILDKITNKLEEIKQNFQSDNKHWMHADRISLASTSYLTTINGSKYELAKMVSSNLTEASFKYISLPYMRVNKDINFVESDINAFYSLVVSLYEEVLTSEYTSGLYEVYRRDAQSYVEEFDASLNLTQHMAWFAGFTGYDTKSILNGTVDKPSLLSLVGLDRLNMTVDQVQEEMQEVKAKIRQKLFSAGSSAFTGEQFNVASSQYTQAMTHFVQTNRVNQQFYRENFVRVDVFMQELRYEEITQQKAYDVIQFLGDIGGSLGLFIGASLLSVVEIVDIFLHQGLLTLWARWNRGKK